MAESPPHSELGMLFAMLVDLRTRRLNGAPSDRALAKRTGFSHTTVAHWLRGDRFPQQVDPIVQLVQAVREQAQRAGIDQDTTVAALLDPVPWRRAYAAEASRRADATRTAAQAQQGQAARGRSRPGRPLEEVTDPFQLEVHRPITLDPAGPGSMADLPLLPPYVRRQHDEQLASIVRRAIEGHSVMAVLVAGSSAGKTRACWEALEPLQHAGGWRLWHPFDPTRPEAALDALDQVGPRTVVWLNESQEYLGAGGDGGERVAAGLRSLLGDTARAPVLVLGTLWPEHHTTLTQRPSSQVKQLLEGTVIDVPEAFTGADLATFQQVAEGDARLVQATEHAEDGQFTQYLAGGPELLERFRAAPPSAKAVMLAAMDARRMGHRNALSHELLEAAAPAYLTGTQWDQLGDDWLEQALAYTSRPCKGARGAVTRLRHDRGRRGPQTGSERQPEYQLADYLEQHGRRLRAGQDPPTGFWAAAAAYAHPADLADIGDAAWRRGLYRDAVQLMKNAVSDGYSAARLIDRWHNLPLPLHTVVEWALTRARLNDSDAVNQLLMTLEHVGAHQQAILLGGRAAAHLPLDSSHAVARLLGTLRRIGAHRQAILLGGRIAAHLPLDNVSTVTTLLDQLRNIGVQEQVSVLGGRAAAHLPLKDTYLVIQLLDTLWRVQAPDAMAALLTRDPAARVTLRSPRLVSELLDTLARIGAHGQAAALLTRVATEAPLHNAGAVAGLLDRLWQMGTRKQVTALAARVAADIPLDDPYVVVGVLDRLRTLGADSQVALLTERAAAQLPLDNPSAAPEALSRLQELGAQRQMTALLHHAPETTAPLDNPRIVVEVLNALRYVGERERVAALLARDPAAHVSLDDPGAVTRLLETLEWIGADQQITVLAARVAADIPLDDPYAVVGVLDRLRTLGTDPQVAVLTQRAAAHASLDDPSAVAVLLAMLQEAGADQQVAVLARRAAEHVTFDENATHARELAILLERMRLVGAEPQAAQLARRAARQIPLHDARVVDEFLATLHTAGAHEQVAVLARRAAGQVPLHNVRSVAALLSRLQNIGADEQVIVLANRVTAADIPLDDHYGFVELLSTLWRVGARNQTTTLVDRTVGDIPVDNWYLAAPLLTLLRKIDGPATIALIKRLPAAGQFDLFLSVADHREQYRFGREADGRAAEPWDWDDLE